MRLKAIDFIFTFFILSIVFIYFNYYPLNVDSTWILNCGKNILTGSILYLDIIDVNPPLIFIYATFVAFISKLFSYDIINTFIIFVLFLITISVVLSSKILKLNFKIKKDKFRYITYSIIIILTIMPSYDFGQREHLFVIFIFPYIIMMMYKEQIKNSIKLSLTIAIFAALGFNIKPHFFIIFIAIELVYLVHKKSILPIFRIESLIIIFSGFFYLAIIFILFPEYINITVPFAIDAYSDTFERSYELLLINLEVLLFFFTLLFWIFLTKKESTLPIKIIFATILSSLLIYLIQQKGWSYHRLPLLLITIFLLTYISFFCLIKNKLFTITSIPILLAILISNISSIPDFKTLKNIIEHLPKNNKIHIISKDIAEGQALLTKEQIWTSRFPSLFMIPKLIKNDKKNIQTYTFNSIYEDLKKYKPDTIIFPSKEMGFDYYDYLTSEDYRLKKFYEKYYTMSVISHYIILSKNKEYQ